MSLKGTQPLSVLGSHFVFRPSAARICCARRTHPPAPTAGLLKKFASDGFRPEGRKKLTSAAETHVGFSGSQGTLDPTPSGPNVAAPESGSLSAARQRSEEHTSELQSRQYLVCR